MDYNRLMQRFPRWLLLSLFLIVAIAADLGSTLAQTGEARYFPETGHWVSGDFLQAYEAVPDPQLVFGFPITGQFYSSASQMVVQYFEKARFELHPENPQELRVVLSPLGQYLYEMNPPGQSAALVINPAACRLIQPDSPLVCYSFLDFFDKHGGVAQFGYPISPVEIENGRYVQYFQRARFEWRPDLPPGKRVILSNLGEEFFRRVEDTTYLLPDEDFIPTILELRVYAFVQQAAMPPSGRQVVYVIVQDQNLRPVAGAQVLLDLRLPDGTQRSLLSQATNDQGIVVQEIDYSEQPIGIVEIEARVNSSGLQGQAVTFFQIW